MIHLLKMELYHFKKSKSLYVVLLCMIAMCAFSTVLLNLTENAGEGSALAAAKENNQTIDTTDPDNVALGISVSTPAANDGKITVFDLFFANIRGRVIALFLCIFTVIYSLADIRSGYIKNIGGQVKHRCSLLFSKSFILFLFTTLSLLVFLLAQALINRVIFGYTIWGDGDAFLRYFGIQLLLHFALSLVVMVVSILSKSNIIGIIFGIFSCMNVFSILYGIIDKLIHKMGVDSFRTISYTLTGKIALLPMTPQPKDILSATVTGILFLLAVLGIGSILYQKRDINI